MALPGMKATNDFDSDENPKSWREGILWLMPRNEAKLYALTAMMPSEKVGYPQFYWWDEPTFMYTFELNEDLDNSETAFTIVSGGKRLKEGDVLKLAETGEHVRVTSSTSDTVINVTRAFGDGGDAGTAAVVEPTASGHDATMIYIGSAYREGADKAVGISSTPSKNYNYTQIFRDPVEQTRTLMQSTGWRTGDPFANDKKRTAHKHALGIERAFLWGARMETTESSQPLRTTGGITTHFIDSTKQWDLNGSTDLATFESKLVDIFQYGSSEKLAFTSLRVIALFQRLVRINTTYNFERGKEYGMNVTRFFGPGGTIVLTEHPMFNVSGYMENDMLILDTSQLRYRYMQDTTYLRNREGNGVDGKTDEFLTECGLEVHHPKTHYWIKGLTDVELDS